MRKLFDQLSHTLRDFIQQRDDLILLVPCEDCDVALFLKALRDLDREMGAELFLLFGEGYHTAQTFVTSIARRMEEELALTNQATPPDAEKLPALPCEVMDLTVAPGMRLEAALGYARSLVDPRQGQHFVFGLGPDEINNPTSYLNLLAQLTPKPEIRPWMRGARIIARVPRDFDLDTSVLAKARRVRVRPFAIPPNAQEEELAAAINDPKTSIGDRMQAEVQLAYLDYAYSRFEKAIERFLRALAFFQWAEIPVMEGLVICGLGDIARRQGDLREARHWYECAAVPAASGGNTLVLSTVVQNLAAIAFQQQRFDEAEERYAELAALKRSMIDEEGLVEALEWQGLSQERQKAYNRAIECWEEAA